MSDHAVLGVRTVDLQVDDSEKDCTDLTKRVLHVKGLPGFVEGRWNLADEPARIPAFVTSQCAALLPLVTSGALRPPIGARVDIHQVGGALRRVDDRDLIGCVVVDMSHRDPAPRPPVPSSATTPGGTP